MAGKKVVKESLLMEWILGRKLTSDKINGREERKMSSCVSGTTTKISDRIQ